MPLPVIFLSHSSRNADVARPLKEVLARHTKGEIEWWLSSDGESIPGGKNWRSEVEQALRECALLFVLLTPIAAQSAWVHYEAGFADALGKDIVPIALPGFDIDSIPGPLQHKQGFNLRGASGLNNIISVANRSLRRHDLLSLSEEHYSEVFARSTGVGNLPQLLDIYIKEAKLGLTTSQSVIDRLTTKARFLIDGDLAEPKPGDERVLPGPGFVIQEERRVKKLGTPPPQEETTYRLFGEIVASALLHLLPALSDPDIVNVMLPEHGSLDFELRPGVEILTSQAQILARMKGTEMRWSNRQLCSFGDLTFLPTARDINRRTVSVMRSVDMVASEPYRPKEMRYRFELKWESGFPGTSIASLLSALIERQVIFPAGH